jgi:D-glycero-D-manno-heptose 1,7-bisphosphate phosphatase
MTNPIKLQALFLDRDGIINHDPGDYTTSLEVFKVLPQAIELLKMSTEKGVKNIIVTNQAGLDKGLYTLSELEKMHFKLDEIGVQHGFKIDAVYFCPHHPEFSGKCFCRKPGHLLFEKAVSNFHLNPTQCRMIGDRERDIVGAEKAGISGMLVPANSWELNEVIKWLEW